MAGGELLKKVCPALDTCAIDRWLWGSESPSIQFARFCWVPPQPTVESVLSHTVQQQQNQVAQLILSVQTRESAARAEKSKGGELSDTTDGANRAMEVDERGVAVSAHTQWSVSSPGSCELKPQAVPGLAQDSDC